MRNGIRQLVKMATLYTLPSDPIDYGNFESEFYFNPPKSFDDENNLSALLVLKIYGHKVLFTGDMERAGFDAILKRREVLNAVSDASILIAPHHGRECSVHPRFLALANPFWTVISDKGYTYATQETNHSYRQYSRGGSFRGEDRRVLTTRKDGNISFHFSTDGSWCGF